MANLGFISDAIDDAAGWVRDLIMPSMPTQESGFKSTYASPDAKFPVIYGNQGEVAGVIVFQETNEGDQDDIKNELLHLIIVWSEGECESIDKIWIEEDDSDSTRFEDGSNRYLYVRNFPNGMDGYVDPYLTAAGWRASDKLLGKCCSYIRCEYTDNEGVWSGFPQIKAEITGRKISTPSGGPATGSSNPVDQLYDYLKSPIYGKGLAVSDLDVASFQAARAIPNIQVENTVGGGVYRNLFTSNVTLLTTNSVLDNVNTLLKSMRGSLPFVDGKYTLVIEQDDAPVDFELTEDGAGTSCKIIKLGAIKNSNKAQRFNRVIVKYKDPLAEWEQQEAIWPEVGSQLELDLLAEDNGVVLEKSISLETCIDFYEAKHRAKSLLEISREQLRTTATCDIEASILVPGDIIPVTHSFPGWTSKLFRVESVEDDDYSGYVVLKLREHQPYIYDFENTGLKPSIPDTSLTYSKPPAPTSLTATSQYNTFSQVKFTWDGTTTDYQITITDDAGNALFSEVIARKEYTVRNLDLGNYGVEVRAIGGLERKSDWAFLAFTIAAPETSITAPRVESLPGRIDVEPPTPASKNYYYEFRYYSSDDANVRVWGTGDAINLSPVIADVTYTIEYRLISDVGAGSWVDVQVNGVEALLYTWIAYADDDQGTGITTNPAGKAYYGIATSRTVEAVSLADPSVFKWFPQPNGNAGEPALTLNLTNHNHTITTDADGTNGDFTGAATTATVMLGLADDTSAWTLSATDSTGLTGSLVNATYTLTSMTVDQGYVDITATRTGYPDLTARWTVSKSKKGADGADGSQGPQGVQGPAGVDGNPTYTWIRYADDAIGTGISNDPTGKTHIGFAYNKNTATESNTPGDYAWSLIKGEQGDTGVPGAPGEDGSPTYTWIKYSANADGTGLTDLPQMDTEYIGIAPNKTVAAESNDKTDYIWSLFKGPQGLPGADGIDGVDGIDGSNGVDGKSTAQLTIYKRAANAPATPSGGSFNFTTGVLTVPAGWSATVPTGADPVYSSHGLAFITGNTGTDSSIPWSSPDKILENGADGSDGGAGLSVYQAVIFKRASSAPMTPAGGEYDFGTNTLTPPSGWSENFPAGTDPVYTSNSTFTVQGTTGTDTSTWTSPVLSIENGADGENGNDGANGSDGTDGKSSYLFPIYKRSATTPAVPTGGSFNFGTNTGAAPTDWLTYIEDGVNPIYVSTALASITGDTGTDSTLTWSAPALSAKNGIDGNDGIDGITGSYKTFIYKLITDGSGAPVTPTGGSFDGTAETIPIGWTDNSTFNGVGVEYVSIARYNQQANLSWTRSPDWSAPSIFATRGPTGPTGPVGPSAPNNGTTMKDEDNLSVTAGTTVVCAITLTAGTWDLRAVGVFIVESSSGSRTADIKVYRDGVQVDVDSGSAAILDLGVDYTSNGYVVSSGTETFQIEVTINSNADVSTADAYVQAISA